MHPSSRGSTAKETSGGLIAGPGAWLWFEPPAGALSPHFVNCCRHLTDTPPHRGMGLTDTPSHYWMPGTEDTGVAGIL